MQRRVLIVLVLGIAFLFAEELKPWAVKLNGLSEFEKYVLIEKGTESAFSGEYVNTKEEGVYACKVCDSMLYKSTDKFDSHCGWPSFDDAILGAIKETMDADGRRVEITCARCGAHLGHVFKGEGLTAKNVRHCVNSVSLSFKKDKAVISTFKKAYFAGGCFWGVEYYLEKIDGVKEVISGFMGGSMKNPTYHDVVRKNTGHLETVEVVYDPEKVSYETLSKIFFEIHDPTQVDGQGPDVGSQYLSAVFVSNQQERKIIEGLIRRLEDKGLKIATKLMSATQFYDAESYHQDYYARKGTLPYCHRRVKRF
jgi:peptide methionine sulfoxide reductase msrA/msrB